MTRRFVTIAALATALLAGSAAAQLVPGGDGGAQPPAPPPGGVQRDLDKQYTQFLTGRWVVNYNAMGMQYTNDVVYRPDGTLVGTQIVRQYTEMRYPIKGTWKVTGVDEKSFQLHLMIVGSGTQTDSVSVIDQNTIFSENLQENVHRTQ